MIEPESKTIPVKAQCDLIAFPRSTYYDNCGKPEVEPTNPDKVLMDLVDGIFTDCPFYGSRKMVYEIRRRKGWTVNRKRVQRIMRRLGLEAIVPWKSTSDPHPHHRKYPYLLRNVRVVRVNQVWSADITYVQTRRGYCYLVAVVDWHSRKVLSWRMSNTLDAAFCAEALEEAIAEHGIPEIFNTDQGSLFTSDRFISVLESRDIWISMDGKGRALDNVFVERFWRSLKYENIYVKGYETLKDAKTGISEYMDFYNGRRIHESLSYRTPDEVYYENIGERKSA